MTYNPWLDALYGNFRTRTFSEIFPDVETFIEEYQDSGIEALLDTKTVTTLYYLLYARYGNGHIASSDENTFKYRVWSNIFMYGPTWEKRLEIQAKLRELSEEELLTGSKAIFNHAFNPSTAPKTSDTQELDFINEQNTNHYKNGIVDGYTKLWDILKTDVTRYFIDTFQPLFLTIIEPENPLWYITQLNAGGDSDDD